MSSQIPQFKYWHTTFQLEMILLRFVRSIRCGEFGLYVNSLSEIAPWCFTLDHSNYARWLSVHIRDMLNLENKHPELYKNFTEGYFVIKKTNNPFAMIGLDQNHEQENHTLKENGGSNDFSEE